jgi:hypothetical protein
MGEPLQQKPNMPLVDLDTIRETLLYIRDDMQRVPGLEGAAEHLTAALGEITAAERRRLAPVSSSIIEARFVPRRKH